MIRLPWRSEPEDYPDPQMPPVVTELELGEKPAELIAAAAQANEWTRPTPIRLEPVVQDAPKSLTVPWQSTPPTQSGVWWWCEPDGAEVRLCVVLRMGRGLCVKRAWPDGAQWTSVEALKRWWSGPIPHPEHMSLEDFS